jgi:hypothetical protein
MVKNAAIMAMRVEALFLGRVARRFGRDLIVNPFKRNTILWRKFREGWLYAEEHPYSFQLLSGNYTSQGVYR